MGNDAEDKATDLDPSKQDDVGGGAQTQSQSGVKFPNFIVEDETILVTKALTYADFPLTVTIVKLAPGVLGALFLISILVACSLQSFCILILSIIMFAFIGFGLAALYSPLNAREQDQFKPILGYITTGASGYALASKDDISKLLKYLPDVFNNKIELDFMIGASVIAFILGVFCSMVLRSAVIDLNKNRDRLEKKRLYVLKNIGSEISEHINSSESDDRMDKKSNEDILSEIKMSLRLTCIVIGVFMLGFLLLKGFLSPGSPFLQQCCPNCAATCEPANQGQKPLCKDGQKCKEPTVDLKTEHKSACQGEEPCKDHPAEETNSAVNPSLVVNVGIKNASDAHGADVSIGSESEDVSFKGESTRRFCRKKPDSDRRETPKRSGGAKIGKTCHAPSE